MALHDVRSGLGCVGRWAGGSAKPCIPDLDGRILLHLGRDLRDLARLARPNVRLVGIEQEVLEHPPRLCRASLGLGAYRSGWAHRACGAAFARMPKGPLNSVMYPNYHRDVKQAPSSCFRAMIPSPGRQRRGLAPPAWRRTWHCQPLGVIQQPWNCVQAHPQHRPILSSCLAVGRRAESAVL
jgi:hypothetical protein